MGAGYLDIERRIDRQEPATARSRDAKLVGDLIALHRADLEEVGRIIGRSKDAGLSLLDERIGHLRIGELDRERLIKFGKERAAEGAGPVTVGMNLGYIKTICSHAAAESMRQPNMRYRSRMTVRTTHGSNRWPRPRFAWQ